MYNFFHYRRTQHKLDHLQKSVCSIQISRESLKRQLSKTTAFCKELVAEQEKLLIEKEKLVVLLKEREKENENIQHLGNNIAHRMGNLRSQLKVINFIIILRYEDQFFPSICNC